MTTDGNTAAPTKPKRTRTVARKRYVLCEITTVEGSADTCLVILPPPPGIPEDKANNAKEIERWANKAVYEQGLKEYGNKKLIVAALGEEFEVPFEERAQLVPKK